ncbi:MAG: hypothetical protein GXX96_36565 [Planctomycetaceae bacterium]|nr:hypothetical protein [Planctomycetaceae bacterium]
MNRPALQFSLAALFILTTVFALALSVFLGISRFLGISAWELLSASARLFIYSVPRVVVWSIGLSMAVRRLRSYRKPAILATAAMSGFIVTMLLAQTVQMTVIAGMNSGRFAISSVGWLFTFIGLISTCVDVVCWILILMAIFSGRPVACSPFAAQTEIVDPFSQEEPIVADRNETGVSGEGRYTDDVPDPQ